MYNDLIRELRGTPSRSKRNLLDKAAQAIEDLTEWRDVSNELPVKDETACNVIVSGTYGNIKFQDAVCQAIWYKDDGWVLEAYPDAGFGGLTITHWLPLPPLLNSTKEG